MVDTLTEITNFYDNFYDHNAVVSDLCDGKSLNKIAITFFPISHGCFCHFLLPILLAFPH